MHPTWLHNMVAYMYQETITMWLYTEQKTKKIAIEMKKHTKKNLTIRLTFPLQIFYNLQIPPPSSIYKKGSESNFNLPPSRAWISTSFIPETLQCGRYTAWNLSPSTSVSARSTVSPSFRCSSQISPGNVIVSFTNDLKQPGWVTLSYPNKKSFTLESRTHTPLSLSPYSIYRNSYGER